MKTNWFSYYTIGTPYEVEAYRCRKQFAKFGLDVTLHALHGDKWMGVCLARSQHLNQMASQLPGEFVGLLDSDLLVLRDPALLKKPFDGDMLCNDAGMGISKGRSEAYGRRYSAGIVSFAPTKKGRELLALWADLCRENQQERTQGLVEQFYLYQAVEKLRPKVEFLHEDYNYLPNPDCSDKPEEKVVLHCRDKKWVDFSEKL